MQAVLAVMFLSMTQTYTLPKGLLSAVCWVESNHKISAVNRDDGSADSLGVCQVQLNTAKMLGFKGTVKQLMNPKENVKYAAKYLSLQLKRYHGDAPKALSAYNAGTATKANEYYVNKVLRAWNKGR